MATWKSTKAMESKRSAFQLIMLFCMGAAFSIFLIALCTVVGRFISPVGQKNTSRILVSINDTMSVHDDSCTYHKCFDVYSCGSVSQRKVLVYIYPEVEFFDESEVLLNPVVSAEFLEIITSIRNSEYYTSDPKKACLFLPYLDLLNQEKLRVNYISKSLSKLEFWNGGANHLLFNMLPGTSPDFNERFEVESGSALVAGGGFSSFVFRHSFDISVPVFSPWLNTTLLDDRPQRVWFLISSQPHLSRRHLSVLTGLSASHDDVLVATACSGQVTGNGSFRCSKGGEIHKNPDFLQLGTFCLVLKTARLGQPVLVEALGNGCIPVIAVDNYVLPFSEVLEWKRAAVLLYEYQLPNIYTILKGIPDDRIESLRLHGRHFFQQYMSSMGKIALTTLEIINERLYPLQSKGHDGWNVPKRISKQQNMFLLPMGPPKSQGFTAVVLTYDRLESLFVVIENLALVPSLVHVVVVWNNVKKSPPSLESWPKISKQLTVIRSDKNVLSNRFLPFKEIKTEAVLSIDDDITMLTADELEFGFQAWREFPDRVVGFPSRTHLWSNASNSWVYDSEWGNSYSLVLTGASFYHKYWHHIYATELPTEVKNFVDEHMNCEDIAMNFLFANKTGKSPIKVAPRKKFKCPTCTGEMLSADASHLAERSYCVSYFAKLFGNMDLKYAEYRADPTLYRDKVPEPFKLYSDIGSL